jgi:arylsulfatase A-like enzyme
VSQWTTTVEQEWFVRARRSTLLGVLLLALCCRGASAPAPMRGQAPEPPPERRPNVILVFVDDMGYGDLSAYGNTRVRTENIDRLAREGIRFTQFYVNSPICSPSRVAVTTGTYPSRWGIHSFLESRRRNRERGMADYLDPDAPTLARTLEQAGYATAHFGKWHMGGGRDVGDAPLPQAYGFDESLTSFEGLGDRYLWPDDLNRQSARLGRGEIHWTEKYEMTRIYVDHAIDFIQRHRDEPFYLNLWPNDVHDEHEPRPGAADRYAAVARDEYERRFFAVLEDMDRQLGRLFDEVRLDGQDVSRAFFGQALQREPSNFWYYPNDIRPGNPAFVTPELAVREGRWKLLVSEAGDRVELYDIVADPGESSNVAAQHEDVAHSLRAKVLAWWASVRPRRAGRR